MVFKPPTVLMATQPCAFKLALKQRIEKTNTKNLFLIDMYINKEFEDFYEAGKNRDFYKIWQKLSSPILNLLYIGS
jgi:hypothetical protein